MKKNVRSLDSSVRMVIGAVLLVLTFMGYIGLWGLLGVVLLVTGLFKFCPLYQVFGFSFCRSSEGQNAKKGTK